MRVLLLTLAIGLVTVPAFAQAPVLNPTTVDFTASPDHNLKKVDGVTDIVSGYEFTATGMNSAGAVVITVGFGKPTPNGSNVISMAVPQLATITANTLYTAVVKALGQPQDPPGVSAPSAPFARTAPQTPAVPGQPTMKP